MQNVKWTAEQTWLLAARNHDPARFRRAKYTLRGDTGGRNRRREHRVPIPVGEFLRNRRGSLTPGRDAIQLWGVPLWQVAA
jgi:hypothetical protein